MFHVCFSSKVSVLILLLGYCNCPFIQSRSYIHGNGMVHIRCSRIADCLPSRLVAGTEVGIQSCAMHLILVRVCNGTYNCLLV